MDVYKYDFYSMKKRILSIKDQTTQSHDELTKSTKSEAAKDVLKGALFISSYRQVA